jgi:fatty acid desaturase
MKSKNFKRDIQEIEKSKQISNGFGFFILSFWAFLIALYFGGFYFTAAKLIPIGTATVMNTIILFYLFVIFHEAIHKNINGSKKNLNFVNSLVGNLTSVLLNIPFSGYSKLHLAHHTHTNSKHDPDLEPSGNAFSLLKSPTSQIFRNIILCFPGGLKVCKWVIRKDKLVFFYLHKKNKSIVNFYRMTFSAFCLISFVGFFKYAFFLWILPSVLATYCVFAIFSWVPHISFLEKNGKYTESENPYKTAKNNKFFISAIFTGLCRHHLEHHLYPNVQFNRLKKIALNDSYR